MALLTKGAIMNAFEEMLLEMSFDKITVSALVKRRKFQYFLLPLQG